MYSVFGENEILGFVAKCCVERVKQIVMDKNGASQGGFSAELS